MRIFHFPISLTGLMALAALSRGAEPGADFEKIVGPLIEGHCVKCHDSETKKGGLDLEKLGSDLMAGAGFETWIKVHDRLRDHEMPPPKKSQPGAALREEAVRWLDLELTRVSRQRRDSSGRSMLRRLNRTEYENTLRDLLCLPGLLVRDLLPEDGRAHGFDKSGEALEFSHVQLDKYLQAAHIALTQATASQAAKPELFAHRFYAGAEYDFKIVLTNGDAVFLKDFAYDPQATPLIRDRPLPGLRELEESGVFPYEGATGVMRHEDDAFMPRFQRFAPIYSGFYRLRLSLWSYAWNKGAVGPGRQNESASLVANGRLLGYFDAPSLKPLATERVVWLNAGERLFFNAASLPHIRVSELKGRAAEFVGPGIAIDWLDVEGPLEAQWPPASHRRLFGELELGAVPKDAPAPKRAPIKGRGDLPKQPNAAPAWMVISTDAQADSTRLLSDFLRRAFRRPVAAAEVARYVGIVQSRMEQKASFEDALRTAYSAALCAPDFLYLEEKPGALDGWAIASRLSYFLWNSMPDDALFTLAEEGRLGEPTVLDGQVERMLADPRSERFVESFVDQWLDLREIDLTTPDRRLYPEFAPILRDSMVAETRAFFRELLARDLPARELVRSDFAMLNQRMAEHYDIAGVTGSECRRVELPAGSHRGGVLTQASILKITANGTTTSPVKRGAWVLKKLLGQPPAPPPPSVPALEPDVRGATTIRELLAKHRSDASCASCHSRIDPPGFALESFDVIGGWRTRYRSVGEGDNAEAWWGTRAVSYKNALAVDPSGETVEGTFYRDIDEFRESLLKNPARLDRNLAAQLVTYATGSEPDYADRPALEAIVSTKGGIRSLIHALVKSPLFLEK